MLYLKMRKLFKDDPAATNALSYVDPHSGVWLREGKSLNSKLS